MAILFILSCISALILPKVNAQCLSENDSLPLNIENHILQTLNDAAFNFSVEYFQMLANDQGLGANRRISKNIFASPFSIWQALTLVYFGSEGKTEEELSTALKTRSLGKLWVLGGFKLNNFILQVRSQNATPYLLKIANRVYFDSAEPVRDCMKEILQDDAKFLHFAKNPDSARRTINKWVSDYTYERIRDLVAEGALDSSSRFVIVNAAYFKGKWQSRFKSSDTKKELFYVSTDKIVYVDMMKQKGFFEYALAEDLGASVLKLPYKGGDISMFVFLPPFTENGLHTLVSRLTPERIRDAIISVNPIDVKIALPKFKMEHTLELKQIDTLFDPERANLSSFSSQPGLYASTAVHKSFVNVDEEGSEAAAASAIFFFRTARLHEPETFIVNHPFLFIIYDHQAEIPLFMGVVVNPTSTGH